MRKAIATFGTGPARKTLALAMPTFMEYGERHSYEIVVGTGESAGRPPSWGKVPLLQGLLREYDFVLWLDADTIILDGSVDVASIIPGTAFQAFVVALCGRYDGFSPNMGVWAFRSGERSQRFLGAVWEQEDLINHRLWEQAAAKRILGWSVDLPFRKILESEWDDGTYYLPEEWNVVPVFPIGYSRGFIRHYGGMSNTRRLTEMRTDLAEIAGQRRTGPAKVLPLVRSQLGLAGRAAEKRYGSVKCKTLRATTDPIGVLARRVLAMTNSTLVNPPLPDSASERVATHGNSQCSRSAGGADSRD